jgi:NAD(P)-dependent dehydrogenase (short-subunit alcohol dehydrogenase family)
MDVKGKVTLITGASSGIGKATAELFSREGAQLALAARSYDKLVKIASGMPGAIAIKADMTRPDEVRQMVKTAADHFGRIDILINNAGQGFRAPVEFTHYQDLAYLMSLNVYGPLIAMQEVIPLMRKQGGGTIVNISSGTALASFPTLGGYAATKAALRMISNTARNELAGEKIVVSTVLPGATATDFSRNVLKGRLPFTPQQMQMPPLDPVEVVSEGILDVVRTGDAEKILARIQPR